MEESECRASLPGGNPPSSVTLEPLRDAMRPAWLLALDIELCRKTRVIKGRKIRDLYQLLKDVDRSRQAHQKRFGTSAVKQVDNFHIEPVRALAEEDPVLVGSDYPGPSA